MGGDFGDIVDGVEAFVEAELVFDFFLGAFLADEFISVGVVPAGEVDFGGWTVAVVVVVEGLVRWWRENWELN